MHMYMFMWMYNAELMVLDRKDPLPISPLDPLPPVLLLFRPIHVPFPSFHLSFLPLYLPSPPTLSRWALLSGLSLTLDWSISRLPK